MPTDIIITILSGSIAM